MHVLTAEEIADIDYALQIALQRGHTSCDTMTKEDFPLRSSAPTLDLLLASIENDMGMFVLRGFPVKHYTVEQMRVRVYEFQYSLIPQLIITNND